MTCMPSSLPLLCSQLVVATLLSSTALLVDMFMLTGFFLAIFGTMCVQLFGGALEGRCAHPDFSGAFTDAEGVVQVSGWLCVYMRLCTCMCVWLWLWV